MAEKHASTGFMGWLGRQVGHVARAIRQQVGKRVVYRSESLREAPVPDRPGVTLRRRVIDEVVVDEPPQKPS